MKQAPVMKQICSCGKVFHARLGSMMLDKGLCATCAEIYTEQISTGYTKKTKKKTPAFCEKKGFHEWLQIAKDVMKCQVCKKAMPI